MAHCDGNGTGVEEILLEKKTWNMIWDDWGEKVMTQELQLTAFNRKIAKTLLEFTQLGPKSSNCDFFLFQSYFFKRNDTLENHKEVIIDL